MKENHPYNVNLPDRPSFQLVGFLTSEESKLAVKLLDSVWLVFRDSSILFTRSVWGSRSIVEDFLVCEKPMVGYLELH